MMWLDTAKGWARRIKRDVVALWIAGYDRGTPATAKVAAACVAAYALSPVDFIPDVVPILGYLDDLVIVPLGIAQVVKLIPAPLMVEFRAAAMGRVRPVSRAGLAVIIAIWLLTLGVVAWAFWPYIPGAPSLG